MSSSDIQSTFIETPAAASAAAISTAAGVAESHPHDVTITREAPNYSRK